MKRTNEKIHDCHTFLAARGEEMHIGLFTDCYSPQVNGVVTSVKLLEEELINRGHKVTVITVRVPGYEEDHANVLRIPSVPFRKWKEFRLGIPLYNETYRKIKKLGLDVIHTHTEFTVGMIGKHLASMMGIPVIHTYHTLYEDYTHYVLDNKYGKRMIRMIITTHSRFYVRSYDSIIAPSAKTEKVLRSYGVKNRINIIPTGIDLEKFRHCYSEEDNLTLRRKYGLDEGDYMILSLGRISKEKDVDAIIRQMPCILKRIPEAKLLIVGDGPFRRTLEMMVEELNLRRHVIFTGQVPFDEVGRFYSAADLFANASHSETQGLTIVEAMASKLPVVVYDDLNVEGLVLDDVSGRLFKEEKVLGEQIIRAYEDKKKTDEMIQEGSKIVSALSKENFAANVEALYDRLVTYKYANVM